MPANGLRCWIVRYPHKCGDGQGESGGKCMNFFWSGCTTGCPWPLVFNIDCEQSDHLHLCVEDLDRCLRQQPIWPSNLGANAHGTESRSSKAEGLRSSLEVISELSVQFSTQSLNKTTFVLNFRR